MKKVSNLVVNETESKILSGIEMKNDDLVVKAAEKLKNLGCQSVIITLGVKGSFIYAEN